MTASLVISNGTAIDGTGTAPIRDGIVLIEKNRILAVGRAGDLGLTPGLQVIDVGGRTILPRLIDAHVHNAADPAVRRQFLKSGITSLVDLKFLRTYTSVIK